ncbi:MAG: restriction endonuclease subunit S [Methanobrevibacter smithii]
MRFSGFDDEWKSYKLGEIGLFKNGVNKSKEDFGSGYPFINLEDIFDKDYLLNKEYSLVKVSKKELKEYNLNKGDVLFVRSSVKPSGVGLTTVINENLINTVFSGFIIRFRENKQILDLNFKRYCFNITSFRNSLMSKSTTSANTNINQQSLSKLTINAPCIDEQKKIASFLEIIDKKIELLNKKSEYYIKFKKYLMQQIFTQKLRFDFDEIRLKSISKINKGKQLNKEHMLEIGKFYVLNGGQEPSGYTDSWNTSENTITISEGGEFLWICKLQYRKILEWWTLLLFK